MCVLRERYRHNLDRGLWLGHEVSLENEDIDAMSGRHWTVTYKTDPLRSRELLVNSPQASL